MSASELAVILRTTEANAMKRAVLMKLTPRCGRCGGSGSYSFNAITGSRCFGCHGHGHVAPQTASEMKLTIEAAKEAAEDGRLDKYLDAVAARRESKDASKRIFAAWKASTVTEETPSHVVGDADCTPRQLLARRLSARIHAAYKEFSKVQHGKDFVLIRDRMNDALKVIEQAEQELAETSETEE